MRPRVLEALQSGRETVDKDALPHPGTCTLSPDASMLVLDTNQLVSGPVWLRNIPMIALTSLQANVSTPAVGTKWTNLISSTRAVENDVEGSVLVKNPSKNIFVLFLTART